MENYPSRVNSENSNGNDKEKINAPPIKNKSCYNNYQEVSEGIIDTETFFQFLSTAFKLNSFLDSNGVSNTTSYITSSGSGAFDLSQLSVLQGNSECSDPMSLKLKLTQVLNEGSTSFIKWRVVCYTRSVYHTKHFDLF